MIPRVTEIVSALFPEHQPGWLAKIGYLGKKSEDQILTWSQDFGTEMHAWCLKGITPKKQTLLMKKCKKQFDSFMAKESPKFVYTEKKLQKIDEFGDITYTGTSDLGVRIRGQEGIVELKFFKCWRWWQKFRIPSKIEPEIDATKAAKTNLQTKLYEIAQDDFKPEFRAVLWITPDFYVFKRFSREPTKIDDALTYAASLKNKELNF